LEDYVLNWPLKLTKYNQNQIKMIWQNLAQFTIQSQYHSLVKWWIKDIMKLVGAFQMLHAPKMFQTEVICHTEIHISRHATFNFMQRTHTNSVCETSALELHCFLKVTLTIK